MHAYVFSGTPLTVCILNVSKYCCPSIFVPRVLHFGAIHFVAGVGQALEPMFRLRAVGVGPADPAIA